jgi:CDP-diacylglycerol pyrophosphatase
MRSEGVLPHRKKPRTPRGSTILPTVHPGTNKCREKQPGHTSARVAGIARAFAATYRDPQAEVPARHANERAVMPRRLSIPRWRDGWHAMSVPALACLAVLAVARGMAANPNALWHIVGDQCVPNEKLHHSPRPCEMVDLAGGYAVLKDIVGNSQFLLIPTTRVSGIESPQVLEPDAPNYWQAAWQARRYVDERAHRQLPRNAIGLAINSVDGRTQNQLHIHVDCMRLDVIAILRERAGAIGSQWAKFPVPLVDHDYLAMRLTQADLTGINPFVLLADGVPEARGDMGHFTLVVVGATYQGKDGFVLLAGHANPATRNWGSGEELQDHACAVATVAAQ